MMLRRIRHTLRSEEGASAVEYGLLIAGIAALIMALVFILGGTLQDSMSKTSSCITNKVSTTC